jgi:glycosyltransferase involved in cell wall biosynthesis
VARILFLIIGYHKPSSKRRVLDSVPFLEGRGHTVSVREFPGGVAGRVGLLAELGRHDLIVVQKKLLRPLQLSLMKALNRRILFDLDDAVMFHEIERNEPLSGRFFSRFVGMAKSCRGVIAGNGYLAEFARAARARPGVDDTGVVVLPTPVDTSLLPARSPSRRSDRIVIGWIGTRGNLGHLERIGGSLRTLCERHGGKTEVVLKVVSDGRPDLPGVVMEYKPWSAEDEVADLQSFDIGVMPLSDDLWTRGKGGFKLLQYMAAGAAAVASPVGINQEIVRHGENGLLARNEAQWERGLETLITDRALRERLGKAARETVEQDYSLEAYNQRLAAFLEGML